MKRLLTSLLAIAVLSSCSMFEKKKKKKRYPRKAQTHQAARKPVAKQHSHNDAELRNEIRSLQSELKQERQEQIEMKAQAIDEMPLGATASP